MFTRVFRIKAKVVDAKGNKYNVETEATCCLRDLTKPKYTKEIENHIKETTLKLKGVYIVDVHIESVRRVG